MTMTDARASIAPAGIESSGSLREETQASGPQSHQLALKVRRRRRQPGADRASIAPAGIEREERGLSQEEAARPQSHQLALKVLEANVVDSAEKRLNRTSWH